MLFLWSIKRQTQFDAALKLIRMSLVIKGLNSLVQLNQCLNTRLVFQLDKLFYLRFQLFKCDLIRTKLLSIKLL